MVTGDQIESKTFDVKNHVKKNETGEVNKKVKSLGAHCQIFGWNLGNAGCQEKST